MSIASPTLSATAHSARIAHKRRLRVASDFRMMFCLKSRLIDRVRIFPGMECPENCLLSVMSEAVKRSGHTTATYTACC